MKRYIVLMIFFILGCDEEKKENILCQEEYATLQAMYIDEVVIPEPAVTNTVIEIKGGGFIDSPQCVEYHVRLVGNINGRDVDLELPVKDLSFDKIEVIIDKSIASYFGSDSQFIGDLDLLYISKIDGTIFEYKKEISFEYKKYITPEILEVDQGEHYINDFIIVKGNNFLMKDEGEIKFIIYGDFTTEEEDGEDFYLGLLEIKGILNQGEDRSINGFMLPPGICNLQKGNFIGKIKLCNIFPDGHISCSEEKEVNFHINESYLIGFSPSSFSIGQIVDIIGRGFVGGTEDSITTIRLRGYITTPEGTSIPIDKEIVPRFVSGDKLKYTVVVTNDNVQPISEDFQVSRGEFDGEATLILIYKDYQKEIGPIDFYFTIAPVKQVVWIRFMDDFNDTLELFGLRAVSEEIKRRAIEKVRRIYEGINIEFRTTEPTDFYPGGYSIVDVGGKDPNGLGLFGYDNTPGKDVNNLRLHDRIGGVNAITQEDGAPGYGGVFIESYLFFSTHPELDYTPSMPPQPDPLFDEVFDPVRYNKVKAGEYPNGADPERLAEIERAISALSNMIGDTIAHEIGHSLGLANPEYPEGYYHNLIPMDGCLMDSGGERPFEERAELNGNPGAHFCGKNLEYLKRILPIE